MFKYYRLFVTIIMLLLALGWVDAQSLTAIKPDGAEQLKFGQTLKIKWLNSGMGANDYFQIFYSKDGANFVNFYNGYFSQVLKSSDTTYVNWTIPDFGTDAESQVKIRILNYSTGAADTTNDFRVYFEPSVKVTIPTGMEQKKFGETMRVSWLNGDLGGNDYYQLFYSKDGANFVNFYNGYHSQVLKSSDTTYVNWTIPDFGTDDDSQVRILVNNYTRNVSDTSEAFRVYFEPSVKVTVPNGAEQKKFGETMRVSWLNGDLGGNDYYQLFYSKDGANFVNFFNGYYSQVNKSGDTTYRNWTIPDFNTDVESEVRILVNNYTRNVSDTSESFRVYFEPSVKITLPDSSHQLKFGDKVNVTWLNGDMGSNDYFQLYYSKDGGNYVNWFNGYYSQMSKDGDLTYRNWTVPDFNADTSSQVKLVVYNSTRGVSDTSDVFKVYFEPAVNIVLPDSSVALKFGDKYNVTWTNGDLGSNDYYQLYYSKDGGSYVNWFNGYYSQMSKNGDLTYRSWTVPDFNSDTSSQVKLVVYNSTRNVSDTSQAFKVYFEPSVKIISPFADEYVLQSTSKKVTWVNGDVTTSDYFQLYYSKDGGSFVNFFNGYYTQMTNTDTTSSRNWNVPVIESNDVRIRVYNSTRNISDTSASFVVCASCPAVSIYKPNGGQTAGIGRDLEIAWSVGTTWQATDSLRIEYSIDGGGTYDANNPIFAGRYSAITDNKFIWNIDAGVTSQARIRITNVTQSASDVSDADFTIVATPATPTDFAVQENPNQTVTLSWTDNATNETYSRVEYSSDKINWYPYSGNLAVDATSYTTPNLGNNAYWWRVRVFSQYFNNVSEERYGGGYTASTGDTPFGKALAFDGTDDIITLPDSSVYQFGTGDFSIEMWMLTTKVTGTQVIASNYNGASNFFVFYLSANKLRGALSNGVGDITSATALEANTWYHVALVRSGDTVSLYLDGVRDVYALGVANRNVNSNSAITIGKQGGANPYYFSGQMDEIRIWNDARTASEIAQSMNKVLSGSESSLAGYYQMDHTTGIYAADKSSYQYHATWSGPSGANTTAAWVNSQVGVDLTPSITVNTPNGGESLTIGQTYDITWSTANIPDTDLIEIRLSTNGGSSYSIINDGNFGMYGGTYQWTVPNSLSSLARIQIANTTKNISDESDANFAIAEAVPQITMTYPNGGETLTVGKSYTIKWVTANIPATDLIEIRLSKDGGQTYSILNDGTFGDYAGSYQWTAAGPGTTSARIQIANTTQNVSDASDANFTIDEAAPTITLNSPNGGENWTIGQSYNINWSATNIPATDLIEIRLSTDGGSTYSIINDGTFGMYSGTYQWTVNSSVTANARIQIANTTQGVSDASNADFNIAEPVVSLFVTSPNGGENWTIGQTYNITWSTANIPDSDLIEIKLSTDGGASYSFLNDGTFGMYGGNYSWTVNSSATTNAKIQINNTTKGISDESNANFTIAEPQASISITSPTFLQVLNGTKTFNIQWTTANIADTNEIEIQFSSDPINYSTIATSTFGQLAGTYQFTVPDITTGSGYLKINDLTSGATATSARFQITEAPKVSITNPKGGETWEVGRPYYITWNPISFGVSDIMYVGVSTDGGLNYTYLVNGTSSNNLPNNRYLWTIPEGMESDNVLLMVANSTLGVSDTLDTPLQIINTNKSIALLSPNGGETLTQAEQVEVKFAMSGLISTDVLHFNLSLDGGQTFPYNISQGTVSAYPDSSFVWSVSQVVTSTARIQVTVANFNIADTTDADFTIKEAPSAPQILSLSATIVGDDYQLNYAFNEPATVYLAIVKTGDPIPQSSAIKAIALGDSVSDVVTSMATFDYATSEVVVASKGVAGFERQQYYNFCLAAEDAELNLSGIYLQNQVFAQFTPYEKDSIVINELYYETGGDNWQNVAEGWIDLPIAQREEITITDERISAITLSGKGLSGFMPSGITTLDSLKTLDVSSNDLAGIPNLSQMPLLTTLQVADNFLDFGDLIPNMSLLTDQSQYVPQGNFKLAEADSLAIPKGSNFNLLGTLSGTGNSYAWYVDLFNTFNEDYKKLVGFTSGTYSINNIDFNKMGAYYVEVQNTSVPGLIITSDILQVWATADLTINVTANGTPMSSGQAYALRNRGPGLPYDSIPKLSNGSPNPDGLTFSNGIVVFNDILLGSYLVSIRGDKTVYLPTYYVNTFLWEQADVLDLKDNLSKSMRMFVLPRPLTPADGSGRVRGAIESNFRRSSTGRIDARKKVKRAGCSLRRYVASGRALQEGEWELVAYVESDDEGLFTFQYIPAGRYRFNIEYPGIPMDPDSYVEFEVGAEGTANGVIELQAEITEDGIAVVRTNSLGFSSEQLDQISIYPNPSSEVLKISLSDVHMGLKVSLIDARGFIVTEKITDGEQLVINTSELSGGIYFVKITDPDDSSKFISYKILVKH